MKKKVLFVVISLLAGLSLLLAACGADAAPAVEESTVVESTPVVEEVVTEEETAAEEPVETEEDPAESIQVSSVQYAGGEFVQTDGLAWVETNSDGEHYFTETERDEWSINLTRDDGGLTIRLDLWTATVNVD